MARNVIRIFFFLDEVKSDIMQPKPWCQYYLNTEDP